MKKIILTFIFIAFLNVFSTTCFSSEYQILPQDKEKIYRKVGETVYFACKDNNILKTKCLIDCGNSKRYESINGFCTYLETGTFQLNISMTSKITNPFHTATVTITNKTSNTQIRKLKKPIVSIKPASYTSNALEHHNTQATTINTEIDYNLDLQNQSINLTTKTQYIDNDNLIITTPTELTNIGRLDEFNNIGKNIDTINLNNMPATNRSFNNLPSGDIQSHGFQLQQMK